MEDPEVEQPTPLSPDTSSVQLRHCIHDLLRTVLHCSLNGTLSLDLGLSPQFCSALLNQGPNDDHSSAIPTSSSTDFSAGVPLYPLYKSLASAIDQSITSGCLFSRYNEASQESLSIQMKEQWEDVLLSKGSELLSILKSIKFQLSVQEPFFSQLKDGSKTVEGRCAVGDYNRICSGDLIMFNNCLVMEVSDVRHYISFTNMLEKEGLDNVLPGVTLTKEGVGIYRNFYTEEKEKTNGVLAIAVSKIASQPYIVLANIIASLGYQGIQSLLGFQHTTGTVNEALPPPRSTIISSFMLPHRPNDVL